MSSLYINITPLLFGFYFIVVTTHSVIVLTTFLIMPFLLIDFKIFPVSKKKLSSFRRHRKQGCMITIHFILPLIIYFPWICRVMFYINSGKIYNHYFFISFFSIFSFSPLWVSNKVYDDTSDSFFFIFNLSSLFLILSYHYAALWKKSHFSRSLILSLAF